MTPRRTVRVLAMALAAAGGCGNGEGGSDGSQPADMASVPDLSPGRPVLGDTIDRVGRPLVNLVATDPLGLGGMTAQLMDDYNHNGDAATWVGAFSTGIAQSLAILDVLDGVCGNQALYSAPLGGPDFLAVGYTTLASALADDQLYLDTRQTSCRQYLAVELTAIRMMSVADCGGRSPTYDVADWTLGLVAGTNAPLSDHVDADGGNRVDVDVFPFLGAPE